MNENNRSNKNYAIITYHAAYNFGSVLQAYATQQAVNRLGYDADIIDYRMGEQRYFYERALRPKYGFQSLIGDMTMLPEYGKRIKRQKAFEKFIGKRLKLTDECVEPSDVYSLWKKYDLIISGSDQIWNKYSHELRNNDWSYMDPYLLRGFPGRKVSYATSVGNMSDSELLRISPALQEYDSLAVRETVSAEKMTALLGRTVNAVLDPTFLLNREEWINKLNLQKRNDERYILVYSLGGIRTAAKLIEVLRQEADRRDCKIKLIMPFAWMPVVDRRIEWHFEYGPAEFLEALYNADAVVTNSYHGTILSVNFGKEFYSICKEGGSNFRKTDILERLGLSDRVAYDISKIFGSNLPAIDYGAVYAKLNALREESFDYLKRSLKEN